MSWCTTFDLDKFAAAAGGYLRSRAAENTLLLSAAQAAGPAAPQAPGSAGAARPGVLFGWWEPPDGGEPRGAFVHDPTAPLLIAGKAPELGAALAATLAKLGRQVTGVDAPTEVADAFAAAWSQRAGTTVRAHRNCRVYRLAGAPPGAPPPELQGPACRRRCATVKDQALLADWLTAFATETAERIASASDLAADLISYGGAVFWEVPQRPTRLRDAAHYLPIPHHRDPHHAQSGTRCSPLSPPTSGTGDPDPPGRRDRQDRRGLHPAGAPPQRLRDRADPGRQPRGAGGRRARRRVRPGQRGRDDHRQEPVGPLGRPPRLPAAR